MTVDLNTIWFLLVGILFIGYAVLDGFDLGVGALHLLTRSDQERRIMINSIGPAWDGNEVWLVTGGGALFAAFPHVYTTVFSGFYTTLMLLLLIMIFRAVAIEVRSKRPMAWWRSVWDVGFSASSILSSLLLGTALGNIARGVSLSPDHEFAGDFWGLLNPYALMVGVTTLALFMMHGAIYIVLKTEGAIQAKVRGWVKNTIIFYIICYVSTTTATLLYVPNMVDSVRRQPLFFAVAMLNMLAIANIPREIYRGRDFRAFLSSCASMAALMTLFGIGMFPELVHASNNPAFSLSIYNAASSRKTLGIMLVIAIIGVPLVLSYAAAIYWVFQGKVKLDRLSY